MTYLVLCCTSVQVGQEAAGTFVLSRMNNKDQQVVCRVGSSDHRQNRTEHRTQNESCLMHVCTGWCDNELSFLSIFLSGMIIKWKVALVVGYRSRAELDGKSWRDLPVEATVLTRVSLFPVLLGNCKGRPPFPSCNFLA